MVVGKKEEEEVEQGENGEVRGKEKPEKKRKEVGVKTRRSTRR